MIATWDRLGEHSENVRGMDVLVPSGIDFAAAKHREQLTGLGLACAKPSFCDASSTRAGGGATNRTAGASQIFDDDLLSQLLAHQVSDPTREQV
jgi:hypothetical protein